MIKLLPGQISNQWNFIRAGLLVSLPPITVPTAENLRTILVQMLCEHMQCWAVLGEDKEVKGYVLTYISKDPHTNARTLIIYSLCLNEMVSKETWETGFITLDKFAKSNECFRIAAYTNIPEVISVAKKFNFSSDYTYLIKDVI